MRRSILIACLLALLSACGYAAPEIGNTKLLQQVQNSNGMLLVLDVRTPREYASGHVPGAKNIPVGELPDRIQEIRNHDNAEVVVYCESGRRAGRAASILKDQGFLNIRHLRGDMSQWRSDRLPMEK